MNIGQERKEFEKRYNNCATIKVPTIPIDLTRNKNGYSFRSIDTAWQAWRARAEMGKVT